MNTPHLPDNVKPDELLEKITMERDEYLSGWKRALADYENFKKEQTKRTADLQIYQLAALFRELLPLIDTLNQTMKHVPPEQQNQGWFQGLQAIHTQWKQFLNTNGITKIESEGQPFNPEWHEAIGTDKNVSVPDNIILSVPSDGYILNNHLVLRPAKVIVNQITI